MLQNFIIVIAFTVIVSYLMGSLNSAIITIKLMKNVDIRDYGSKNAGLTNTLRCFGKLPALFTLLGDLSKGIIAALLSRLLASLLDVGIGPDLDTHFIGYIACLFAVIGHVYPVFYKFKGGKGVLVCASVALVADSLTAIICISIFAILVLLTKYVSVGSICAALTFVVSTFLTQYIRGWNNEVILIDTIFAGITAVMLIFMHRANIKRLFNGTENKLGQKKE